MRVFKCIGGNGEDEPFLVFMSVFCVCGEQIACKMALLLIQSLKRRKAVQKRRQNEINELLLFQYTYFTTETSTSQRNLLVTVVLRPFSNLVTPFV